MSKGVEISGFLTNLGRYNDGDLVGTWVTLPMTDREIDDAMEEIGVSDDPDADGNIYDEYFWADWECNVDIDLASFLGENVSIDEVNELAESLSDIDADQLSAALELFLDINQAIKHADEMIFIGKIDTYGKEALTVGEYYFDEVYNNGTDLPKQILKRYINYKSLGRDLRLDYANDDDEYENAADYYCGDPLATDKEIGESFVADIGVDDISIGTLKNYFDVEGWGRDIMLEGSFVTVNKQIWAHQG